MLRKIPPRLRASHRLQNLRPRGRRLRHHIQPLIRPVRRHLPPARTGIVRRPHALQQHLVRSRPQRQAKRAVPIIRIEPVVLRFQREPRCHSHRFMPRARNLKKDFLLPLQQDLAVVHPSRGEHDAIRIDQPFAAQALIRLVCEVVFVELGIDFSRGHSSFFTPPGLSLATL